MITLLRWVSPVDNSPQVGIPLFLFISWVGYPLFLFISWVGVSPLIPQGGLSPLIPQGGSYSLLRGYPMVGYSLLRGYPMVGILPSAQRWVFSLLHNGGYSLLHNGVIPLLHTVDYSRSPRWWVIPVHHTVGLFLSSCSPWVIPLLLLTVGYSFFHTVGLFPFCSPLGYPVTQRCTYCSLLLRVPHRAVCSS